MTIEESPPEVKIVLVGQQAVGKTSISLRFCTNSFNTVVASTSGAAFQRKSYNFKGKLFKFQIWDTAGQEKFRSLAIMYYRSAGVAIIVFDVTNKNSFEDVNFWLTEVRAKGTHGCLIYIVANKIDLDRQVEREVAESYAKANNAKYLECSAATGSGVQAIFDHICSDQLKVFIDKKEDDIDDGKLQSKNGCC